MELHKYPQYHFSRPGSHPGYSIYTDRWNTHAANDEQTRTRNASSAPLMKSIIDNEEDSNYTAYDKYKEELIVANRQSSFWISPGIFCALFVTCSYT